MIGHVNRTQTELKEDIDMCEHNETQMNEELKQKALEHDISDMLEVNVEEGLNSAYHAIEHAVVGGYKAIENGVVNGYKAIENGVVDGFNKMTDKIVEKFLTREGETVEEAKQRMNSNVQK